MSNNRSQAEGPGKTEISGKKVPSYRNNKQLSVWLYALIIAITVAARYSCDDFYWQKEAS